MIQILKIVHNAGTSWDKLITVFGQKQSIPTEHDTTQKIDMKITYHQTFDVDGQKDMYDHDYTIGIELKNSDRYSTTMGYGAGGNLEHELILQYLKLKHDGELDDVWMFVVPDVVLPFSKQKDQILAWLENYRKGSFLVKFRKRKPYVEWQRAPHTHKPLSKQKINETIFNFEDNAVRIMNFIQEQALQFRAMETIYSLSFKYGIRLKICESQTKALDDIYDAVMSLDTLINLSNPVQTTYNLAQSEYSIFESMLRSFPGMSENRIKELRDELIVKNHRKYSFFDLIQYYIFNSEFNHDKGELANKHAFWLKFAELILYGKNPIAMKDRDQE